MPFGILLPLFAHGAGIGGNHLHAHGAVHGIANGKNRLFEGLALFGDQGGVCGDAVQNAQGGSFANFIDVGGIDKEFHMQ